MTLAAWQRTVYAVSIAQFIALAGANLIFPFVPFYVKELGVTDEGDVALWSGLLATATGVSLFVFAPVWGALADRFGRKAMLLRAYAGATVVLTLQGFVQNVWQLAALRLAQGAFVGTIPAANALVASAAPGPRVGYSLGLVQMALFLSQFVGPVVGGSLADVAGFRATFVIAGAVYALSFLLVLTQVQESRAADARERESFVSGLRVVAANRQLLLLVAVVFFLNGAPAFVRPIIPLLVDTFELSRPAVVSGFAFSALAATSSVAALAVGRASDRIGYRNALAVATLGAGAAYVPVALANDVPLLLLSLAVVGMFSGGMLPVANALIGALSPEGRQGAAFGLAGSAQALAIAVAPLTGGAIARSFGVHTGFVVDGLGLIGVGLLVLAFVREPAREAEPASDAREPALSPPPR
ncbi:MAG TPA: MFS transporter [Dehalococcoidia bacterium]|nr:MFS transporter [Dehalococcoidia bacterium]